MDKKVKPGDKIFALHMTFTIGEIFYQECIDGFWDVEFIDINGGYHHWKQIYDNGGIIYQ